MMESILAPRDLTLLSRQQNQLWITSPSILLPVDIASHGQRISRRIINIEILWMMHPQMQNLSIWQAATKRSTSIMEARLMQMLKAELSIQCVPEQVLVTSVQFKLLIIYSSQFLKWTSCCSTIPPMWPDMEAQLDVTGSTHSPYFKLKLGSLNVRGLGNKIKRHSLFTYFKNKNLDIVFMQEVHCNAKCCKMWKNEWGGKWFSSSGDTRSQVCNYAKSQVQC